MYRLFSALTVVAGVPVVAFWWFTAHNPWVMDQMAAFPIFFAVAFFLAPVAGLGGLLSVWALCRTGLGSAWHAVPALLVGWGAFAVNACCFVVLIAPGC